MIHKLWIIFIDSYIWAICYDMLHKLWNKLWLLIWIKTWLQQCDIYTLNMRVQTCAGIIPFLLRHYYKRLIGYKRLHFNSPESRLSDLHVWTVQTGLGQFSGWTNIFINSVVKISMDCPVHALEFNSRFLSRVFGPVFSQSTFSSMRDC